jgi:hypothetical protein
MSPFMALFGQCREECLKMSVIKAVKRTRRERIVRAASDFPGEKRQAKINERSIPSRSIALAIADRARDAQF